MKKRQADCQYQNQKTKLAEIDHKYGDNVHILNNLVMQSMLSQFSSPSFPRHMLNKYIEMFYRELFFNATNLLLEREYQEIPTRMQIHNPKGIWCGDILSFDTNIVMVDLARAGTQPAFIGHDLLNYITNPENIRQDHFYINRKTNDEGQVIGVDVSGSKIGGGQDQAFVFFPDPMGATGSSLSFATSFYKQKVIGKPKKYIALHLIITPEYIKKIQSEHPDMEIFALRLDRGASDDDVLESMPGTYPDREFGLNELDYILPGAGGVGEVLNNSYV